MDKSTMQTILDRRSIRSYTDDPISDDLLEQLESAAMASPSAVNYQPWHFTFVRDTDLLDEFNHAACAEMGKDDSVHIFFHAPLVVFIASDDTKKWGVLDSGIAVENLALAAEGLGLGGVIVGMADAPFHSERADEWKKRLAFPEQHSFAISIAIGHPAAGKAPHKNQPDRITRIDGKNKS